MHISCVVTATTSPFSYVSSTLQYLSSSSSSILPSSHVQLVAGSSHINMEVSILASLSPLLTSILSSSSSSSIILCEVPPSSLPLLSTLLTTGSCCGTMTQLTALQDLVISLGCQTKVSTVLEPSHIETDIKNIELAEKHEQHGLEQDPLEDLDNVTVEDTLEGRNNPRGKIIEEKKLEIFVKNVNQINEELEAFEDNDDLSIKQCKESIPSGDHKNLNKVLSPPEDDSLSMKTFHEETVKPFPKYQKVRKSSNMLSCPDIKEEIVTNFHCDHCPFQTVNKGHYTKHMKKKHDEEPPTSFPCDICEYSSSQMGHLKRHKRAKHLGVKLPCQLCVTLFTNKDALKRHVENKHKGTKFPCPHCQFQSTNVTTLKYHIECKHLNIMQTCNICGYETNTKNNLRLHNATVHEGSWHFCHYDGCENKFKDVSSLKYHINSTHEGKKVVCLVCGKLYTKTSSLNVHMRMKHRYNDAIS